MTVISQPNNNWRIIHRYLGFFLAGIMAVYAISGIILIFRDTDFLKNKKTVTKEIKVNAQAEQLSQLLDIRKLNIQKEDGNTIFFGDGQYNKATGKAVYVVKEYPFLIEKLTHLHKAKSSEPLFFLNIFFGLSLLFFVISAFWMFTANSSIFRKGLWFTLGGIVLVLIMLFV